MKLEALFEPGSCRIVGDPEVDITGLSYDSRSVQPGDLFFCIRGTAVDGNRFAKDAVRRGAAAVMSEELHPELGVPQALVSSDRAGMAEASAAFYLHPARRMRMVGITGTNGKTTTTYMIKHIAERAGLRVGLIGTICNLIGREQLHTERTTPESPDLQALLSQMADAGCDLVVMEVSSHALELARTGGIQFDVGIFSNLTQDHLDFHGDLEHYAAAKERLFASSTVSLINIDDPAAKRMAAQAADRVVTYGFGDADLRAEEVALEAGAVRYQLCKEGLRLPVQVGIPGRFSVYNSMAAAGAAIELGISPEAAAGALADMPPVAGRVQPLDTRGRGFTVLLDYAHTPDSLENVLCTARAFTQRELIVVFGCGGDRDAGKRPQMGRIAAACADRLFVTSDNPRFEDPLAIIAQIEEGIPEGTEKTTIENRREAIAAALASAQPGDVVVLAGKGHEDYQEIRGEKHPFDETVVVSEILDAMEH